MYFKHDQMVSKQFTIYSIGPIYLEGNRLVVEILNAGGLFKFI